MYLKLSINLLVAALMLIPAAGFGTAKQSVSEEIVFSLKLDEQPFKQVAEQIYRQTGYTLIYDEKWETLPVSGWYNDVTLEEFFRRVFKKQNTSLLFEKQNKLVALRFFGDKSFEDLLSNVAAKVGTEGDVQLYEDIQELHAAQRQELQAYLNDPESVDPMSGEKLTDIGELHSRQRNDLEQSKTNPNTIEPTSGTEIGKINALHKQQREELQQMKDNPETIEPDTQMTTGEIAELHRQQRAERARMLNDPNTIDPISGMKLSEIWAQKERSARQ